MRQVFAFRSRGEGYTVRVFDCEDGWYEFTGDFDIDCDGSPEWFHDPCGSADTSLHYQGRPINSQAVPGIVLPPECIRFVTGIVIGCQAEARYNGKTEPCVVFDVGPHQKAGEGSPELARRLGIPDDPIHGGLSAPEVLFRWQPGVPAVVDGITYKLTPWAV